MSETIAPALLAPATSCGVFIIATPDRLAALQQLVAASGARLLGAVTPGNAAARLADQISLDLLLFDASSLAAGEAADVAIALAGSMAGRDCRIVTLLDVASIDAVAGPMFDAGATLLCNPSPTELAAALAGALAPGGTRLHDAAREREAERLRLLNEEVARLAEVLSQLAADPANGVRDRSSGYRGEPLAEPDPDPRAVRSTIRARRLRDQHFAPELFADPAWDMLLDLYAARLEGRRVSVSSLCIAAAVPPTTALRWIGTMHDAGLFGREPDPTDKRRAHITLTDRAAAAMRGYFRAAERAGLVPA
ncbi:winged helix DNA-binding protein [Sphingomonas sp.]|uniref:winged helix DNA-binding protein n=1 Tax=Sphingomonas sp. TaxID=28214 RepID=UPI002ED94366